MGLQDFRRSAKEVFRPDNLLMIVLFGLFFAQLIIHVANIWFEAAWPEFLSGKYIMLFLGMAGVYMGVALVRRTWAGDFNRQTVALIIVAGLIVAFLLTEFKSATQGTLFAVSARAARAALGMP